MTETAERARKTGYHHGDLRAALVASTRALVEAKGPDHFSVAEAARAAGVSTAAPYRHFKDRDELLAAVCLDAMARHHDQMVAALAPVPPATPERIKRLGEVYVAFARAEPAMFRLSFGSRQKPEALEKLKGDMEEIDTFGIVVSEVADVLGLPHEHPEARRRAFLLWTIVHGLSFLLIDDKVQVAGIEIDVDAFLDDVGRRVLSDPPAGLPA